MKRQKTIWILGISVLILLCVIAVCVFFFTAGKSEEKPGKISKNLAITKVAKQGKDKKIDFEELKAVNSDIYAWIYIPDTNVDYPVLQSKDDSSYYLNNTFDKKQDLRGAIYTENLNTKDFTDPNTVIYGHNMKDESMFSNLHKYEDESFMKESPYVYIYTPDVIFKYQVFATAEYDDRHLLNSINFNDSISFEEFLNDIRSRRDMVSHVNEEVFVDTSSKIITLSTCNGSKKDTRWLVAAVLTEEKEVTND